MYFFKVTGFVLRIPPMAKVVLFSSLRRTGDEQNVVWTSVRLADESPGGLVLNGSGGILRAIVSPTFSA